MGLKSRRENLALEFIALYLRKRRLSLESGTLPAPGSNRFDL
jgi:hypothetical protein